MSLNLRNIHPLSDFQRSAKAFLTTLKDTQSPIVLTVNGKAAVVVQDAQSYQRLLERTKIRVNAKGGGRPPKLTIAEQVCLCLFYLRHLPTFEVLGLQFGVSKTEANDTFHYWVAMLRKLLPASLLEQLENEASELEMVLELLSEFRLIVDSTEQPRQRPRDQKQQQQCFSGKKKQHTFKNQLITLPEGKDIVDVIVGATGPTSDISLFRTQQVSDELGDEYFSG